MLGGSGLVVLDRRLAQVGELWFDEHPESVDVDVLRFVQRSEPTDDIRWQEFHTILVDLRCEPEALLAGMGKDTRYEIRRAGERDGLVYRQRNCDDAAVDEFCDAYARFSVQKGLPGIRKWWLQRYAEAGALDISEMDAQDCSSLVWHVYYRGRHRVRLLHSVSLYRVSEEAGYRNMMGRANRYHHWQDMLRFRAEGISAYDLGGWYPGISDHEKLRINQFKEEFGGKIVKNYNGERPLSLRGRLYLQLLSARQLVRRR
jgi:hypothetical protein